MAQFGSFIVAYNILPEVAAKMLETLDQIVKKTAFDLQAHAQAEVVVGPTGFLKSSIYVVTHDTSSYGQDVETPAPGAELLPEMPRPAKYQALVAVGANYGIFVEMGTVKMPARPYLAPAAELVRPAYDQALSLLEAKMASLNIPTGDTSGGMGGVQ